LVKLFSNIFAQTIRFLALAKREILSQVHFYSSEEFFAQAKIILELDLLSSSFSLKRANFHSSDESFTQAKKILNLLYFACLSLL